MKVDVRGSQDYVSYSWLAASRLERPELQTAVGAEVVSHSDVGASE